MTAADHNRLAVGVFNTHAEKYQERFMDVSLYAAELDFFLRGIPRHGKVLDLACGPGNVTKHLLEKRPDLQIYGSDLAPKMVELARKNNPGASFEVRDCRHLHAIEDRFHGILCSFVLPYLSRHETNTLLEQCTRLLETNGILYLSWIMGDHADSGPQTTSAGNTLHMYYYGEADLRSVLKDYEIVTCVTKESPANATVKTTDMVLVARKTGGPV